MKIKLPINPKRIALVRDLRMLDSEDWPDDMRLKQLWHFAILTGFEIDFFRQYDPLDFGEVHICSGIGELSEQEWLNLTSDSETEDSR